MLKSGWNGIRDAGALRSSTAPSKAVAGLRTASSKRPIEWKALCCYVNKTPIAPDKPPTIRQAVFMVAGMGGHMGRKGDGLPGTQTIWRGLVKLYVASEVYAIFTQQFYPHPMQSGP